VRSTDDIELKERLEQRFGINNVFPEWDVARNSQDVYCRHLYCPQIDFAVGPFNIDGELGINNERITLEFNRHLDFLNQVTEISQHNGREIVPNNNPRCFLAIEVERSGSMKHRLGSIVNASAIGKIGLLIVADEKNYNKLTRIKNYLDFLQLAGKTNSSPKNVLIVRRDEFINLL